MPKTVVVPFEYTTYQCSCGWTKIGDKRTTNLAIKLHNKQNHAGQDTFATTYTELEKTSKSVINNSAFTPKVKPPPKGLML